MTANFNDDMVDGAPTGWNGSNTAEVFCGADVVATTDAPNVANATTANKSAVNPGLLVFLGCAAVVACGFLAAAMATNSAAALMDYDAFIEAEWQILAGILSLLWSLITGIFGLIFGMLGL